MTMETNIEVLRGLVEKAIPIMLEAAHALYPVGLRISDMKKPIQELREAQDIASKLDETRFALKAALAAMAAQAEAQVGGEVDVTGFGTPPLMHDERADAEKLYSLTAFDYAAAPIGSRDWTIYWRGWWHRSLVYGDTTPPPSAVPEGLELNLAVAEASIRKLEMLYPVTPPEATSMKAVIVGVRAMLAAAPAKEDGHG